MDELKPDWVKLKPEELKVLVSDLAKEGHSASKMGLILRDHHGIPKIRAFGSRLEKYMSSNSIKFKSEREILEQKIAKIKTQVDANKQDKSARKALIKHSWKLSRLLSD